MTSSQLQEYARFGAQARLQAIEEERNAIVRAFPDFGRASGTSNGASSPATRGRKGMSPAQRKAVGARMKAYWANRRAEKAGSKKALSKAKRKGGMSAEARKAQGERMKAYWAARRAQKVNAAGEGPQSETARQNGAPSSKRGGNAGRKHGRKK
jgi:hypothetical protein